MIDYLAVLERESARLSAAAAEAGPDAPVPSCPDWQVRNLVEHITQVFARVEMTLLMRSMERLPPESLPSPMPSFDEAAPRLIEVLAATDPHTPVWNWTVYQPKVASFWPRRMAQEATIHRVDAELALSGGRVDGVTPVEPDMAVDGIDELFDAFLTSVVAFFPTRSSRGSLHVHATDTEGEWLVSFEGGVADITRSHAKGDGAVRGTASDLLLLLWNRFSLDDDAAAARFEVFGDRSVLDNWRDLKI